MPIYRYECPKCEEVTEVVRSVSDRHPRFVPCDSCGERAERSYSAEHSLRRPKPYHAVSTALAVKPEEVQRTIEEDRRYGSMADEYRPDGRLVFKSMKKHRDYARVRGYHDKHAWL